MFLRHNFVIILLVVLSLAQEIEERRFKHHKGGYKPHPPKCHPQTITKYKTIHKQRKANVVNQVEVLNPRPHIKKITEIRHTTIRYPVFITQVIKPLLTQVETKVKPIFFTKTIATYTKVVFTVTGIGQKTVTSLKYEKEYVTRCQKKGYHRRTYDDGPEVRGDDHILSPLDIRDFPRPNKQEIRPPPGIPYDHKYVTGNKRPAARQSELSPSFADRPGPPYYPLEDGPPKRKRQGPPRSPIFPLVAAERPKERRRPPYKFEGRIGNVDDLYIGDVYYGNDRGKRSVEAHPPLLVVPQAICLESNCKQ